MELAVIGVLAVSLGIVGIAVMLSGTPPYSLSELVRKKRHAPKNGAR